MREVEVVTAPGVEGVRVTDPRPLTDDERAELDHRREQERRALAGCGSSGLDRPKEAHARHR